MVMDVTQSVSGMCRTGQVAGIAVRGIAADRGRILVQVDSTRDASDRFCIAEF
jgi:hypothetical protein